MFILLHVPWKQRYVMFYVTCWLILLTNWLVKYLKHLQVTKIWMSAVCSHPVRCSLVWNMTTKAKCVQIQIILKSWMFTIYTKYQSIHFQTSIWKLGIVENKFSSKMIYIFTYSKCRGKYPKLSRSQQLGLNQRVGMVRWIVSFWCSAKMVDMRFLHTEFYLLPSVLHRQISKDNGIRVWQTQ